MTVYITECFFATVSNAAVGLNVKKYIISDCKILVEGGAVFNGTIKLTSDDNGTADKPVVFTSYGKGKAIINAGDGKGLLAVNTSFLKLSSLNFKGSGVNTNKGSGILNTHTGLTQQLTIPAVEGLKIFTNRITDLLPIELLIY